MAIKKGKRYNIFARDSFTCQYCGRRPPEVVLEVDHIDPRANCGTDDEINLLTSCMDCNQGKSAKLPGAIAPRPDADLRYLQTQQEIAEARRYLDAKAERDSIFGQIIELLSLQWEEAFDRSFSPDRRQWQFWMGKFSADEIEEAIRIASGKYRSGGIRALDDQVRYVSGILHCRREEVDGAQN